MSVKREVVEGLQLQGVDEEITYVIDSSNWGGSPTSPAVVVKDGRENVVTATVMPSGSPSVGGDNITLPPLKSLTEGDTYRVEVKFTVSPNIYECYFFVKAEL